MHHWILLLTTLIYSLSASFSNATDLVAQDGQGPHQWGGSCTSYSVCKKNVDRFEFVADDGGVCIQYNSDGAAFLNVKYEGGETRKVLAPDIYNIDMSGGPEKAWQNIQMTMKVENICAQAVPNVVWSLTQYSSDGSVDPKVVERDGSSIGPAPMCWATVPDSIEFGTLLRGETKQITVPLKFWGDEDSMLNIKSDDIWSDSEHQDALHLGGGEDVIVYLLNEKDGWFRIFSGPDMDKTGIELEATVDMNAETGPRTSILTVTLECN